MLADGSYSRVVLYMCSTSKQQEMLADGSYSRVVLYMCSTSKQQEMLADGSYSRVVLYMCSTSKQQEMLADGSYSRVVLYMSHNICFRAKYIPAKRIDSRSYLSVTGSQGKGSVTNTCSRQGATSYSLAALGKASIATIDLANTTRTRAKYRSNWRHFVNFCRLFK